ncbi:hypothetical protein R6Q59_017016 [Mikania micrantha]
MSLDLSTEEFKEIPQPLQMEYDHAEDFFNQRLGVIVNEEDKECLCIYSFSSSLSGKKWVTKNKWEPYNESRKHYRSKWWNKFSIEKANVSSVQNYYKSITSQHERSIKSPVNLSLNTFEDQDYIIRLQSCSTPEEMQRIISEIKKNSYSQSRNSTTDENILQDSQDPYEDIGPI